MTKVVVATTTKQKKGVFILGREGNFYDEMEKNAQRSFLFIDFLFVDSSILAEKFRCIL